MSKAPQLPQTYSTVSDFMLAAERNELPLNLTVTVDNDSVYAYVSISPDPDPDSDTEQDSQNIFDFDLDPRSFLMEVLDYFSVPNERP